MSYIDREKLIDKIEESLRNNPHQDGRLSANHRNEHLHIIRMVAQFQSEDVAPIKHGEWVYEDVDIICSVCGGDGVMPWNKSTQHKFPYCPHCGAKMNLESGEGR